MNNVTMTEEQLATIIANAVSNGIASAMAGLKAAPVNVKAEKPVIDYANANEKFFAQLSMADTKLSTKELRKSFLNLLVTDNASGAKEKALIESADLKTIWAKVKTGMLSKGVDIDVLFGKTKQVGSAYCTKTARDILQTSLFVLMDLSLVPNLAWALPMQANYQQSMINGRVLAFNPFKKNTVKSMSWSMMQYAYANVKSVSGLKDISSVTEEDVEKDVIEE